MTGVSEGKGEYFERMAAAEDELKMLYARYTRVYGEWEALRDGMPGEWRGDWLEYRNGS